MAITEKIACAPTISDYHILADMLMERCLNYKTMRCPPMTKRTLELGARHSPDMICTPFKYILGNFIEAAEKGATVFVMPGVGCRLGFYDILHKQILLDLGYEFEMFILFDYAPTVKRLFRSLKGVNPSLTLEEFNAVFDTVVKITLDMDELANYLRRNIAFEVNKGEFERTYRKYLEEVKAAKDVAEAESIGIQYRERLNSIATDKPERPVRIGIVGEVYAVVEPFSNCYMEKWLAANGVEIIRNTDLSSMVAAILDADGQIRKSGGYVDYNIGGTANEAIAQAYEMIAEGVDGIIHVKPASCSPEITAMSILQNISRDHDVPIMYLTFDTETGEAGIHTRLEAFFDMIVMKGQSSHEKSIFGR